MNKKEIDIAKITEEGEKLVSSEKFNGMMRLVTNIYPESAHFIYELLQNAEDARASIVNINVEEDELFFEHNGKKQFDYDDVWGITSFDTTKNDNYISAGKFGIGFKSIYVLTDTPFIYCDDICFRIDKMVCPSLIEDFDERKRGWTVFRFPFNGSKMSKTDAYNSIKKRLEDLEVTTLLFLQNIKEINYSFGNCKRNHLKASFNQNNHLKAIKIDDYSKDAHEHFYWLYFSKKTSLQGKPVHVDIAYPLEKTKSGELGFARDGRGGDKASITFYAHNEHTNLKFHINAPFGCTPSRDTINKDDEENAFFINEIADLVVESMEFFKTTGKLNDDLIGLLPIEEDNLIDFYKPIQSKIKTAFYEHDFLQTALDEKRFVCAKNAIVASKRVYNDVFTDNDLQLFADNDEVEFIKLRTIGSRPYKFILDLGVEQLNGDYMLLSFFEMTKDKVLRFLNQKNDKQLEFFYEAISDGVKNFQNWDFYIADYGGKYVESDFEDIICELPFAKLRDGEFVPACDGYVLTAEIDVPAEFRLIEPNTYTSKKAKDFLLDVGGSTFDKRNLENYYSTNETRLLEEKLKAEDKSGEAVYNLAKAILDYLEDHNIDEISFEQYSFILGSDNSKKVARLCKPDECYLDVPYIEKETGLANVSKDLNLYALSSVYLQCLSNNEYKSWIDFLKKIGVLYKLEINRVSNYTWYSTGYDFDYEVALNNFNTLLNSKNVDLSLFIWKEMNEKWKSTYAVRERRRNKNYSRERIDSTVLIQLSQSEWIPDSNGKFHTPFNITRDKIDKRFLNGLNKVFLKDIQFGKIVEKKKQLKKTKKKEYQDALEKVGLDSDLVDVIHEIQEAGMLDEFNSVAHSFMKSQQNSKEFTSMNEVINSSIYRKQQMTLANTYDSKKNMLSGFNNNEIKKSVTEILDQSDGSKTKDRYKSKRIADSNKSEREFMKVQYLGRCQICDTRILKATGEPYFEATNLIDTKSLGKKYLQGMAIGWNTICLCPNCAAKYRFSQRSIDTLLDAVMKIDITEDLGKKYNFVITLQNEIETISFTAKHLLALQTALSYYD